MPTTIATSSNGKVIELSGISSDYDPGQELALQDIQFFPGAASDVCVFKTDSATGPLLCKMVSGDGEPRVKYFSRSQHAYMDYSDGSYSSGAKIVLTLA